MIGTIYLIIGALLYLMGIGAASVASNISSRIMQILALFLSIPLLSAGAISLFIAWRSLEHGDLKEPNTTLGIYSSIAIGILVGMPVFRTIRSTIKKSKS